MTRRKQLIAGCAVVCLLILVASWFLIATPRRQAVADLQAQAAQQESTNAGTRTQVAVLKDVASRLPQAQQKAAALGDRVPTRPELVALIRQLADASKRSGTQLTGITPTKPAALAVAPGLSSISLTLTVSGDYAGIEEFESQLEDLKRSFLVTGVTVAGGAGGSSSGSTASASGTQLTETVSGQVLLGTPSGSGTVTPLTSAKSTSS